MSGKSNKIFYSLVNRNLHRYFEATYPYFDLSSIHRKLELKDRFSKKYNSENKIKARKLISTVYQNHLNSFASDDEVIFLKFLAFKEMKYYLKKILLTLFFIGIFLSLLKIHPESQLLTYTSLVVLYYSTSGILKNKTFAKLRLLSVWSFKVDLLLREKDTNNFFKKNLYKLNLKNLPQDMVKKEIAVKLNNTETREVASTLFADGYHGNLKDLLSTSINL